MSYTPNTWIAPEINNANSFVDQNDNALILTSTAEVITAGTPISADWLNNMESGISGSYPLVFTNVSVATSAWASDSTYTGYPYAAVIACIGVTASMMPEVVFSPDDASAGIYAPVATSGAGTVTIYASEIPSANITIPTILAVTT